jgi:RNA polymerase sigma-70 factor (ECF subfamily)
MKITKFELILRDYGAKVYNYILKILQHREDAEDVMQETFLAFFKKMDDIDEKALVSYLYRIAHNKSLNFIRKRKKENNHFSSEENLEHIPQEIPEEDAGDIDKIKVALTRLSASESAILEMQFYQKKSYKEIAEVFGISEKAVDGRLVRAKRKLKKLFLQDSANMGVLDDRGKEK